MFCASMVIMAVLACAEGGYEYRLPGVPFQLANHLTANHNQQAVQKNHQQTFEAHIGIAHPLHNGYNFLQQQNDGQGSLNGYQTGPSHVTVSNEQGYLNGYPTSQNYGTASNGLGSLNGYQTGQSHVTVSNGLGSPNGYQTGPSHVTVSNEQGYLNGYPTSQNYGTASNGLGSLNGYQTGQSHVTVSNGLGSPNGYQTGQTGQNHVTASNELGSLNSYQTGQSHGTVSNELGSLNGYQTGQSHATVSNGLGSLNVYRTDQNQKPSSFNNQQNQNSGLDYNSGVISTAPAQPVQAIVTKHIYFHVAPPDTEEKRTTPVVSNRKKTYNIVFIKVPAQQSRYAGYSQLLRNQYAVSEMKTLIYVLVKKPEQLANKQATPNHEVFYVKYRGNPDRAVSQLSSDISQTNTLQSLQPGLINGQS